MQVLHEWHRPNDQQPSAGGGIVPGTVQVAFPVQPLLLETARLGNRAVCCFAFLQARHAYVPADVRMNERFVGINMQQNSKGKVSSKMEGRGRVAHTCPACLTQSSVFNHYHSLLC
jgi:hypothetical protein